LRAERRHPERWRDQRRRSGRDRLAIAGRAFILGGTGNVGAAIAHSLAANSWNVTLAGKTERPVSEGFDYLPLDRNEDGALSAANGFDLVVDVIPFEAAHARQLLELDTGALVAISSASVYADEQGRTLDEAQGVADFPDFPGPIPETQPTVEPGDETYSTKKAKIERILLENGRVSAAIVRPCAIYGKGDRMGREWFFVKRALDRRPHVVLTNRGTGQFHTTAAENIGELVRLLADQPRTGAYNCGDPDPPTVLDIARAIGDAVGHRFAEVLLDEPGGRAEVGQTPWSAPKPLLIDMTKAEQELGYRPATTWGDALPRQVRWLVDATRDRDWREVLTRGADYLKFEYEAEDELVASLPKA
jgi:nucleoside-diphosphate-sugar epimerase